MPRPPTLQDFPTPLQPSLLLSFPPTPRSLLILLHGLGDTHTSFASLGSNLNLPHTACISIRGPSPLPALFMGTDETGWHWGDDVLVDERTGDVDMEAGFDAAGKVVGAVMKVVLGQELGFEARDVFFWGYGQGGMVALSFIEAFGGELGGIVSIGGKLPASPSAMRIAVEVLGPELKGGKEGKAKTPVLLCGGNAHTAVTAQALREAKERIERVQYVKWEREGDGMARNREEMLPVMKFLAGRLRMPLPVGMEEVGGVTRA